MIVRQMQVPLVEYCFEVLPGLKGRVGDRIDCIWEGIVQFGLREAIPGAERPLITQQLIQSEEERALFKVQILRKARMESQIADVGIKLKCPHLSPQVGLENLSRQTNISSSAEILLEGQCVRFNSRARVCAGD